MTRTPERTSFAAAALLALVAVAALLLHGRTGLLTLLALVPLAAAATLVALTGGARLRLARLAEEERLEELAAAGSGATAESASLFSEDAPGQAFTAARSHGQFVGVAVPVIGLLIALLLSVWSLGWWSTIPGASAPHAIPGAALAVTFAIGQAFLIFLFTRFLLGMAREPGAEGLRAGGRWLGVVFGASLVVVAAGGGAILAGPVVDRLGARLLLATGVLLSLEIVVLALTAWYHPQRRRQLGQVLDSRLAVWISEPAGWGARVAATMDYQFGQGPRKSRLLTSTVLPLAATVALLLWVMTAWVFIAPHEAGLRERLGQPAAAMKTLSPGAHLVAPWPFDRVTRVPVERMLSVQVGFVAADDEELADVFVWELPHYREEHRMLVPASADEGQGNPVALVLVNLPVEYRITDPRAWAFEYSDPEEIIRLAARRIVTHTLATRSLNEVVGSGRTELAETIRIRLQEEMDRMQVGVEVVFAGLHGVHPPSQVAEDFQSVIAALERSRAVVLEAKAYAAKVLPEAEAARDATLSLAESYHTERQLLSQAEVQQFKGQQLADKAGGIVYRHYARLRSLERTLADTRLYLVDEPADTTRILEFDFQEAPNLDFLEAPTVKESSP